MLTVDGDVGIELGPVLARAGEGTVYEVIGRPDWVAKVFHPELTDLSSKIQKVAAMVGSPQPAGSVQSDGFVVLTWPLQILRRDGVAVGYVMHRIDTATAVEIHGISNPSTRAEPMPSAPQWTVHATWHHLVSVAANLCLAVQAVHRVDAVIGDFQERNILVNDTTRVSLVDCDSMQFTDGHGHRFLCGIGRPEFTAPELAGTDLRVTARDKPSDLFALAVHIHLLLMGGNHPFLRGSWTGEGPQPDAMTLARSGDWAGGPGSRLKSHPLAPSVGFLPDEICRLFARAFTVGARDPAQRPRAAEWRASLLRVSVVDCSRRVHQIPSTAVECPWCANEVERRARRQQRREAAAAAAVPLLQDQLVYPVSAPGAGPVSTPRNFGVFGSNRRIGRASAAGAATVAFLGLIGWVASLDEVGPEINMELAPHTVSAPAPPPTAPLTFVLDPSAAPPPHQGQIAYNVTGTKNPGDIITVTYTDAAGRSRTQRNVYIPWSLTVTPVPPSAVGSVQAVSSSGEVVPGLVELEVAVPPLETCLW